MSFNAFVNFGDIKGESTDKDHKDWVTMTGYEQGVAVPQHAAAARASTTPQLSEFKIHKLVDAASPKLYEACCKGTHLPNVTIELYKTGKDRPVKFLSFTMKDVLISSVTADAKDESQFPSEVVNLTFGAIEWTYTKLKPDGTAAGDVTAKWDLNRNAPA